MAEWRLDLGREMPGLSRISPASCIYIDAEPFSWTYFAGIPRYTARLALALAARLPLRFFHGGEELRLPRNLRWSQDQDLEDWGRRIWRGRCRPLGTPAADSIGLYCSVRPPHRTFPYEVSILHDFCPMVVPWAFLSGARDGFVKHLTEDILASDLAVSVSHSTKADAAWFSPLDPERIIVAPSGPSLCVESHCHPGRVTRSNRIGLVVSTIEPRKNAGFLFEWFQKTTLLPRDTELWWAGKLGWMMSRDELERIANPPGGRRIRLLGNVSDAQLCRLYQQAGWSIYPSKYEGFGFPILDSLRHGTPVLASCTSSMGEFDHPGVFFFDPADAATVDRAWQRLQASRNATISRDRLDGLYSWDLVSRALLDAHAHSRAGGATGRRRSRRPRSGDAGERPGAAGPAPPGPPEPEKAASPDIKQESRMRIGIEVFGTQTASRHRGIGRYSYDLVVTLLARDPANEYVLYAQDGLTTDQIPTAPNAVLRLLRPDPVRGETTLAHAVERLTETNPDGLDVLLLLNPLEMAPGYDVPAKPLNRLKMVALVFDLIPLLFQEEYFSRWPGPEFVQRYLQGLNRLRNYDALMAISEPTRRDVLSFLGASPDRVVTIGTGSDGRFFVPDRADSMPAEARRFLQALGIAGPFVFSVGSLEYRKNLWGLIDAFAMLPAKLRQTHQLVLTYGLSGPESDRVRQYAEDRGVVEQLVLTDRLADKALRVLYQRCAAFVFPSLYEGFGLPIVEAMQCGAPVVAGNNSSQTEIVGDAGLLFNAADAGELAAHLVQLLDDPGRARARRTGGDPGPTLPLGGHGRQGAGSADRVARPRIVGTPAPGPRRAPRRRIAFFSPLPPLRSGVSDYSARLLEELKRRYKIDLYHDAGCVPHIGLQFPDFGCYDFRVFERNARVLGYHALVYQMGNSPYHGYMYDILLRHPGIVTLHDLCIAGFHFWYARQPGADGDAHIGREFEAFFGEDADEVLRSLTAVAADATGGMAGACIERGYHLNGRIFERATAVIVHSPWCVEQVRGRFPAHLGKTSVVPFGATALDPSPEERRASRARFDIPHDALVIASLGLIHATKMNVETIEAFAPLAGGVPEAVLIFVGSEIDNGAARRAVMDLGLQHRVRFLGHYPGDLADLAAVADIGVCLRRPPTNGETSASLIDLLRLGVPTVVSDVGSFSCYPDSVVRKHRWESGGLAGLTRALRELAEDRPRREALGRSAWHYIRQNHAWSRTAESYEEIIERTVAQAAGPRAAATSAAARPRVVASPEWTQAAS